MADYYVDSDSSDDSGDGSIGDPWKYIAAHVDDLSAGDTMHVRGDAAPGRIYYESPIAPTVSGTSGNPITIKPYTGEYVILKTTPASYNFTFDLTNDDWWTLDGLKFDRDYVNGNQVNLDGSSHIRILNCELYQNGGDAAIEFSADNTGDDVLIDNCIIYDTFKANDRDSAGIGIAGGTNITISNCTIYDCRGDCIVVFDNGSVPITDFIIEDNHLYTTVGKCSENAVDIKKGSGIIRRNVIHGFRHCDSSCGGSGGWAAAAVVFHEEAANVLFEENEIYDSAGGITVNAANIDMIANRFHDIIFDPDTPAGTGYAITVFSSSDINIWNNTFHDVVGDLYYFWAFVSNLDIKNNLAYETNTISVGGNVSYTTDYNGWFDCVETLVGANDTTGSSDPGFVDAANDDYHLLGNSVAIDAGVDVGLPYEGAAPDLGYDEYAGDEAALALALALGIAFSASVVRAFQPPAGYAGRAGAAYKLRLCSAAGVLLAEVVDFWRLGYTKRVNAPGLLTFNMHGDHAAVALLENKSRIEVWRRNQRQGIDWYRDFDGLYLSQYRQYTDRNVFTAYCPGQMWLLSTRIVAWYAKTADRSQFTGVPAETIMKTLVQYNIAGSATTGNGRMRAGWIPYLGYQLDGAGGNSLDWNCAWKNLLTELQGLAQIGGGDFDLIRTGAQAWEFRWYTGQRGSDRRATVIFALERGNMASPRYSHSRIEEKTAAIVGGQGEEDTRKVEVVLGDDFGSSNDIEIFVDARKRTTTAGLQDAGTKRLSELQARQVFSFEIVQTPACLYGDVSAGGHYELGDLVTARAFGIEQEHKVVGVTVTVAPAAERYEVIDIEVETP